MNKILAFLFDMKVTFTRGIVDTVLKVMSAMLILGWVMMFFVSLWSNGILGALMVLIFGPIIIFLYIALIRLGLEMYFNIADIREILKKQMDQ